MFIMQPVFEDNGAEHAFDTESIHLQRRHLDVFINTNKRRLP